MARRFNADELDVGFFWLGTEAGLFRTLFTNERVSLKSIPNVDALVQKHLALSKYTIPKAYYNSPSPMAPEVDVQTVAAPVQLLTRSDTPSRLVAAVTRILLSPEFQKRRENLLRELFTGGLEFAKTRPEFAIHRGARRVYYPEPRPLLAAEFVEATEGIRSFVFSLAIAAFLGIRWLIHRRQRRKRHKLDECLRRLLDLDCRVVHAGQDGAGDNALRLGKLLAELRDLKQEAVRRCSCWELGEDRTMDCFLSMCHNLANEINLQLLQTRPDKNLVGLVGRAGDATRGVTPRPRRRGGRSPMSRKRAEAADPEQVLPVPPESRSSA
jgi:hypothetical protein